MKKHYTFGEMVDAIQFGEVAVKVSGLIGNIEARNSARYRVTSLGEAIFFDEHDSGFLKCYRTKKQLNVLKPLNEKDNSMYVIMSKEVYDKIHLGQWGV